MLDLFYGTYADYYTASVEEFWIKSKLYVGNFTFGKIVKK